VSFLSTKSNVLFKETVLSLVKDLGDFKTEKVSTLEANFVGLLKDEFEKVLEKKDSLANLYRNSELNAFFSKHSQFLSIDALCLYERFLNLRLLIADNPEPAKSKEEQEKERMLAELRGMASTIDAIREAQDRQTAMSMMTIESVTSLASGLSRLLDLIEKKKE